MNWIAVEALAVSISAVIAAIAFVFSVVSSWQMKRDDVVRGWQMAIVHGLFQRSKKPEVTFDEIKADYRSEAAAYNEFELKKSELSEGRLRQILMALISDRVLEQRTGDVYLLNSADRAMSRMDASLNTSLGPLLGLMSGFSGDKEGRDKDARQMQSQLQTFVQVLGEMSESSVVRDRIYTFIDDNNFKYTVADAAIRISKETTIDVDKIRAAMLQLIAAGVLSQRADNKVGMGPTTDVPLQVDR